MGEADLRHIVRDELRAMQPQLVADITDSVTHAVGDKIDTYHRISTIEKVNKLPISLED